MLDSLDISRLYENVLDNDMKRYNISPESVKFGIANMQHVYGETVGLNSERSLIADYTDPGHRCAYMHKYAALHTAMVRDMLGEAVHENYNFFHKLVFSTRQFKLCSLGGGPGTDVIGALATLHAAFGYFDTSVNVIDYMSEWSYSFDSILKELSTGWYGAFGSNVSYYLQWQYVGANLLKSFKPEVLQALSSASLVTMVKFTSAAACMDTYSMIKNIFTAMKPGAALLFIDNDGGGFHNLIVDAANEFHFISIFGPLRRENYFNTFFKKKRFGYNSCCKTTVTVHLLQKPFVPLYNPYNDNFSVYANQYDLDNYRRVVKNKPSLLGSPPTPFLYLGQSPDENCNTIPAKSSLLDITETLFSYQNPDAISNRLAYSSAYEVNSELGQTPDENYNIIPVKSSPLLDHPYTPSFSYQNPHATSNRLGYSSAYRVNSDFSQGANYRDPGFFSPLRELAHSTASHIVNTPSISSYRPTVSPNTQFKGKRARMQGCFPIKIGKLKHHIAQKMNKVKARARSILKIKNTKKSHPIFKL